MKKILIVFFTFISFVQLHSASNIDWSFPPTALSNASVNSSDPRIAIDTSGDVVAVWVENGVVKANTKVVGNSWGSVVTLSGSGASTPRVVSDGSGNATAVWLEGGVIKAASKPFGGSWTSASSLSTGVSPSSPELAVDSAGNVVAVWARNSDVESSTKLFGAAWQTRVVINSTNATLPCVSIGGSGSTIRVYVVWQGTSAGRNVIYSATKLITAGSFSTQQIISDSTHEALSPHCAVDANANAIAVWYQYDVLNSNYSNVVLGSASRLSGGSWTAPEIVSAPGVRNPATLRARVAFDGLGNAIAVWNTSYDDANFNIESAIKPLRGVWTNLTEVVPASLYSNFVDLSATNFGDVLATYLFYNGATLLVQSTESTIDTTSANIWSVPITYSSGADNGYPRIVSSITGNVIHAASVWVNYDGSHTLILASTGEKTLVGPASSLSVSQSNNNFGVFTEYYNTLSWTASTDTNVVGYLIFRNGKLIQQVDASVTAIIDNNRVQSGAVTYGVVAFDSQGSQSVTVSVNYP